MSIKFDKDRPHGVISGDTENKARFVQDGHEFLANGDFIGDEAAAEKKIADEEMADLEMKMDAAKEKQKQIQIDLDKRNRVAAALVAFTFEDFDYTEEEILALGVPTLKDMVASIEGAEYTTKPKAIALILGR